MNVNVLCEMPINFRNISLITTVISSRFKPDLCSNYIINISDYLTYTRLVEISFSLTKPTLLTIQELMFLNTCIMKRIK